MFHLKVFKMFTEFLLLVLEFVRSLQSSLEFINIFYKFLKVSIESISALQSSLGLKVVRHSDTLLKPRSTGCFGCNIKTLDHILDKRLSFILEERTPQGSSDFPGPDSWRAPLVLEQTELMMCVNDFSRRDAAHSPHTRKERIRRLVLLQHITQ